MENTPAADPFPSLLPGESVCKNQGSSTRKLVFDSKMTSRSSILRDFLEICPLTKSPIFLTKNRISTQKTPLSRQAKTTLERKIRRILSIFTFDHMNSSQKIYQNPSPKTQTGIETAISRWKPLVFRAIFPLAGKEFQLVTPLITKSITVILIRFIT